LANCELVYRKEYFSFVLVEQKGQIATLVLFEMSSSLFSEESSRTVLKKVYSKMYRQLGHILGSVYLLLIKLIITLTIMSLSSGFDSAIINVNATRALSSITFFSS